MTARREQCLGLVCLPLTARFHLHLNHLQHQVKRVERNQFQKELVNRIGNPANVAGVMIVLTSTSIILTLHPEGLAKAVTAVGEAQEVVEIKVIKSFPEVTRSMSAVRGVVNTVIHAKAAEDTRRVVE